MLSVVLHPKWTSNKGMVLVPVFLCRTLREFDAPPGPRESGPSICDKFRSRQVYGGSFLFKAARNPADVARYRHPNKHQVNISVGGTLYLRLFRVPWPCPTCNMPSHSQVAACHRLCLLLLKQQRLLRSSVVLLGIGVFGGK